MNKGFRHIINKNPTGLDGFLGQNPHYLNAIGYGALLIKCALTSPMSSDTRLHLTAILLQHGAAAGEQRLLAAEDTGKIRELLNNHYRQQVFICAVLFKSGYTGRLTPPILRHALSFQVFQLAGQLIKDPQANCHSIRIIEPPLGNKGVDGAIRRFFAELPSKKPELTLSHQEIRNLNAASVAGEDMKRIQQDIRKPCCKNIMIAGAASLVLGILAGLLVGVLLPSPDSTTLPASVAGGVALALVIAYTTLAAITHCKLDSAIQESGQSSRITHAWPFAQTLARHHESYLDRPSLGNV